MRLRSWFPLVLVWLLLVATPASVSAQHLDVGVETGRMFKFNEGIWVVACVPSAALTLGAFSLSTASFLHRNLYAHDVGLTWEREWKQLTVTNSVTYNWYRNLPQEWAWTSGVKWRVR